MNTPLETATQENLIRLRQHWMSRVEAIDAVLKLMGTEATPPAENVRAPMTRKPIVVISEDPAPRPSGRLFTAVRMAIASIPEPFTVKSVLLQLDKEYAGKASSVSVVFSQLAKNGLIDSQGKEGRAFLYRRGKAFTAPAAPKQTQRDNYARLNT